MVALRAMLVGLVILSIPAGTYGPGAGVVYAESPTVRTVGTADFNNDGHVDILRRDGATGGLYVWLMNGTAFISAVATQPSTMGDHPEDWAVAGTGDFDGDHHADILWRHETSPQLVVWLMNGTRMESSASIDTSHVTDPSWRVLATGDFDNDTSVDLLWHHSGSGQLAVWFMHRLALRGGTLTTPEGVGDLDWIPVATGDFGGNGHSGGDGNIDIVWRHRLSGQIVVWYMSGAVMSTGTFTTPPTFGSCPTHWQIGGTGYFDADANVDIVWQPLVAGDQGSTGQNVVWLMGNSTQTGTVVVSPAQNP